MNQSEEKVVPVHEKVLLELNKEVRKKNTRLVRLYELTLNEYNELLFEQEGSCKICGRHHTEFNRALHVDHDHRTGAMRGLLCVKCNTGLGFFNHSFVLLSTAIDYLEGQR